MIRIGQQCRDGDDLARSGELVNRTGKTGYIRTKSGAVIRAPLERIVLHRPRKHKPEKPKMSPPLSEKKTSFISRHWGAMSAPQIAKHLGVSKNTVYANARRMGLHQPTSTRKVSADVCKRINELADKGLTNREIGLLLDLADRTVSRYRRVPRVEIEPTDDHSEYRPFAKYLLRVSTIDDDLVEAAAQPWDRPKVWQLDSEIERVKREILRERAKEIGARWEEVEVWEEANDYSPTGDDKRDDHTRKVKA